jgi:putative hydrolase of the HAD superfamily
MAQGVSVTILGILVDLDETLYSREEGFWTWVESEARDADVLGRLDRDKVAELDQRGRGDKEALLEYLDITFHWHESPGQRLQRFRTGLAKAIRLAPGVRESLMRLADRYRFGLVTNGTAATQRSKLAALGIATLFNPVVISEETGFRKPDVRAFELAILGWGIAPESVLFVGDDLAADIQGAEAAGMRALQVGVEHGISSIVELESWLQKSSP